MVGAGAVFERGRRVEATVLAAAIAGGVIWSNALAYHQVWLAPRGHLTELDTIGKRFAGQGPTLMTEYQPYGVRHFLRRMDPEGASERRTRLVPLVNGSGLDKGSYANLDGFQPAALLVYRTMVLRRSPVESRPPAPYQLVWVGRFYEVWQRPAPGSKQRLRLPPGVPGHIARRVHLLGHLPLSSGEQAVAVPPCRNLLRLAHIAQKAGGLVAAVPRAPALIVDLSGTSLPSGWQPDSVNAATVPQGSGSLQADVNVPSPGRYGVWLGGSFRGRVRIAVDGRAVGSLRDQLNWSNQFFTPFGDLSLARGSHRVELDYQVSKLRPGEGAGEPFSMGPLVLGTTTANVPVTYIRPAKVRSLCGRSLDWAEALGAS